MERANKVSGAISLAKARSIKDFHRTETTNVTIRIDWSFAADYVMKSERWFAKVKEQSNEYFYISSEAVTNRTEFIGNVCPRLLTFLNIPSENEQQRCQDAFQFASTLFQKQEKGVVCRTVTNFRDGRRVLLAAKVPKKQVEYYDMLLSECDSDGARRERIAHHRNGSKDYVDKV